MPDLENQLPVFAEHAVRNRYWYPVHAFLTYIPNQVYLCMMLRIPAFYFGRVARLFEGGGLRTEDIRYMIATSHVQRMRLESESESNDPALAMRPVLRAFMIRWDQFISILVEDWKTLNLISALLLS